MTQLPDLPPFTPTPEAEAACLEMLRKYAPALTSPENVDNHIRNLLDLESGVAGRFEYFESKIDAGAKNRLLVSGCACGSEMIVARRYGFKEIHGTEVVPELLEICDQRFEGSNGFSTIGYDGHSLPYPEESFSSLTSGHIIEHTPEPEAYLREHLRVLRKGGWMFLEFPNRYHTRELHTGVFSVEYLPAGLREIALRFFASRLSPFAPDWRHHYQVIRNTLKPISIRQIRSWLRRAPGVDAEVVHSYAPAPGYVRLVIFRR